VTADVQLLNGQQKTITMHYDAVVKHYEAALGEKNTGEYQVKVFAAIVGENLMVDLVLIDNS
jgi:hypothetical protein